jgi:hypothetical protein
VAARLIAESRKGVLVPDLEGELRATAEDIEADAARLKEIEAEKRDLDPTDPRLAALSADAEALAKQLVPKTLAERELTDALAEEGS